VDLLIPTLQVFVVLGLGFGSAILLFLVSRRKNRGLSASQLEQGLFSPGELERLKRKGLLTEEEAKRVQSIVANRTLEQIEQSKAQPEDGIDVNQLLARAEDLKRRHMQEDRGSEENGE